MSGPPPGQRRQVTQIAVNEYAMYCLCDDGSMWQRSLGEDAEWRYVPDIPQDQRTPYDVSVEDRYTSNRMGLNKKNIT